MPEEIVKVSEIARHIGRSERTVYRLLAQGKIPRWTLRRVSDWGRKRYFVPRMEFQAWLRGDEGSWTPSIRSVLGGDTPIFWRGSRALEWDLAVANAATPEEAERIKVQRYRDSRFPPRV